MNQKERYVVTLEDGKQANVLANTFAEVIQMLGEENIRIIEKLDYEEVPEE